MKIIGSVKEDLATEKRISITPEVTKKFTDLEFSVSLEKDYGKHLGIQDKEYENNGANLYGSQKEVLEKSEIILRVNCPSSEEVGLIKEKTILIGQFDHIIDKEKNIAKKLEKEYVDWAKRCGVLDWPLIKQNNGKKTFNQTISRH